MEKKYVVSIDEAISGVLHGNAGTFRILIDEKISGAQHLSLLVNTSKAGAKGSEHKHDVEHCWYILSGSGTIYIEGEPYRIKPECAVYVPAGKMHRHEVDPEQDMTYVVIYAPPGPEKDLLEKGAHAFDQR